MKRKISIPVLLSAGALIVGIIAAVFAIWPAVADAPWENSTSPVVSSPVVPEPQLSKCDRLREQLARAQTETAATWFRGDVSRAGC